MQLIIIELLYLTILTILTILIILIIFIIFNLLKIKIETKPHLAILFGILKGKTRNLKLIGKY